MKNEPGYILMPAGWYPHNDDPFNGDFVQRHAMSIARYHKVIVVFAVKSPAVKKITITVNHKCEGQLIEYICYYPAKKIFDRFFSSITYHTVFRKVFKQIRRQYGLPKLVHVNIAWKAGLWALYLKRKFGCNYVITENWTGYYDEDPGNIHTKPWWVQYFIKKIFKQALLFLPVTRDLGERCKQLFGITQYEVVENAVDTRLFFCSSRKHDKKRLVHVSAMNYQKHTDGLIRAIDQLATQRSDFELILVGPFSEEMKDCLADHPYAARVTKTTGNIPYDAVAGYMHNADLLVMFSRYENLPCVILEALCCGVPVVTTDVGGIREVINDTNGKLVASGDTEALAEAVNHALNHLPAYPHEAFSETAKAAYSYEAIGKKYAAVYEKLPGINDVQ